MDTVGISVAAALVALLIVRDKMWRRAQAQLREQLAATRAQVSEHEQHAHVGQLMSGLAQDLKSPLQGVIGNTELMIAAGGLGSASANDLRAIQENATRAAGIVRNLLAFTEASALKRRWQDINEVVARAVGGMRKELDASGVGVDLALADRLPLMYVDGRQLEKVLATLLARPTARSSRAGRDSAAVRLATRRGDVRRGDARHGDERLVIEVDDRAADDVDEPAWSSDLAACRQIVQAHGGSLEVEHPANGGFRFHLELPVSVVGADAALAT
jgi:K+-sensing histidine kinase KdpD